MAKKKKKSQSKEIIWNVVNSILAGGLVFLGALSTGNISKETFLFSLITAGLAAVVQFKNYWAKEESEYCTKLFHFIQL